MSSSSSRIVVHGASWCPDARRARRVLGEHRVKYTWIDIEEDKDARDFVRRANGSHVVIPVIVFPDESILVEPTNYELNTKMEVFLREPDPDN